MSLFYWWYVVHYYSSIGLPSLWLHLKSARMLPTLSGHNSWTEGLTPNFFRSEWVLLIPEQWYRYLWSHVPYTRSVYTPIIGVGVIIYQLYTSNRCIHWPCEHSLTVWKLKVFPNLSCKITQDNFSPFRTMKFRSQLENVSVFSTRIQWYKNWRHEKCTVRFQRKTHWGDGSMHYIVCTSYEMNKLKSIYCVCSTVYTESVLLI